MRRFLRVVAGVVTVLGLAFVALVFRDPTIQLGFPGLLEKSSLKDPFAIIALTNQSTFPIRIHYVSYQFSARSGDFTEGATGGSWARQRFGPREGRLVYLGPGDGRRELYLAARDLEELTPTNRVPGTGLITMTYSLDYSWNRWLKVPNRTIKFEWTSRPSSQAGLGGQDQASTDGLRPH